MEKEFVPYELVLRLKELGFDKPCAACYYKKFDNEIGYHKVYRDFNFVQLTVSAPTYSQAFRWFREKYDMIHNIDRIFKDEFGYIITPGDKQPINAFNFNTYEEAELACLKNLIEIVEGIENTK